MDAKLEGGCRFESCCAYLDEKHMAATAERPLIYRFESCPDYSKVYLRVKTYSKILITLVSQVA